MINVRPQKPLVTASSSLASSFRSESAIAPAKTPSPLGEATLQLVHRQFEQQVAEHPNKTAIYFEDQQISYGELNRQANQLARHLVSLGAGPDVLVAVCLERSLKLMVTLLAIHKAGSAYLPLDLGYPSDRIQYILENAQAPLLICNGNSTFPSLQASIINLQELSQQLNQYDASNLGSAPNSRDLAYVIYTSGSTGKPKGVQIEHRSLSNLIQSMAQEPGLTADDVTLAITTICFDISILELFMPLATGATMVLVSRAVASDGFQLRQLLEQQPITWAQATPSTWRMLLASGWQGNSRIRLLSGGEATTPDLAAQLLKCCAELWNVYGPTETTIWSMVHRILPDDVPIPLGKAIRQTQVYLMEQLPNGELYPCMPNQLGEICIGGWGVARGYLNQPELNRKKFITDFNSRDIGAKLYRTGDLGQELNDGTLQFMGRIDHQVKVRGHRVELGEVEAALLQHEQVQNGAVIAAADSSGSQQLIGYLVAQNDEAESWPDLESASSDASAFSSDDLSEIDALTTNNDVVDQWKTLWDDAYRNSTPDTDPTFDFSGYGDSYTGELLSAEVVEEWTERTVERILALKPQRVLEVGCGKGLLLFRIAPHCERYIGVDVTPAAITHLEQYLNQTPEQWCQVSLAQAAAHELQQLALLQGEQFDTIVINSVVQYFPDVDYLLNALTDLTHLLQPGGRIFLGDIRNADLLETFHTSVLVHHHQAHPESQLTATALHQHIQAKSQQDVELLLAPPFFTQLQQRCPRITQVVTQLKRGRHRSELTDFRYDAVLHLDQPSQPSPEIHWSSWEQHQSSLEYIQAQLQAQSQAISQQEQPAKTWGLQNIPNARLSTSQHQLQQLQDLQQPTVEEPSLTSLLASAPENPGLDPEDLWKVAEACGHRAHLRWSQTRQGATYDAIFQPIPHPHRATHWASPDLAEPWTVSETYETVVHHLGSQQSSAQATVSPNPSCSPISNLSIAELHQFLQQRLPAYMVPSQFVFLKQLPLTPNGKINRKALHEPSLKPSLLTRADYAPPQTATEVQLARIWETLLNFAPIGRESHFFESGGHSLLAAKLISQVQAKFSIPMGLSSLFQNSTLAQLAQAIDQMAEQQGHGQAESNIAPPDGLAQQIEADLALADTIHLLPDLAPAALDIDHILLTGATGFVGGFLLQELLIQTRATVHCLVRSTNRAEAQRKLENHLEQCRISWELYRDRIVVLPGDLSQPQLGLSDEQFQRLQTQIDAIYHNGAYVNLIYPYSELRRCNIDSTVEILRLASQGKLKPVHYISTLDVLNPENPSSDQLLTEDTPLPHWSRLSSNYACTKWVAEQLILTARAQGIPCNIYRLGMTTGHSQHGFSNPTDMIGRLIHGLVELQTAPEENFPIHLAPVDVVCQAIAALGQPQATDSHPQGQTFHLSNPNPISFQTLIQSLNDEGYSITPIPYADWFTQLMASPEDNALRSLLADGSSANQGQDFFKVLDLHQVSTANVETALVQLPWRQQSNQLLSRYISYFIRCGALAKPHPIPMNAATP